MLTAPIPATRKALEQAGLSIDDIDVTEINEAFAPVPLAWMQASSAPTRPRSTRTAAPSPWATRWAAPARS